MACHIYSFETILKQMGLNFQKRPLEVTNLDDLYGSHEFNGFFSTGGYNKLVGGPIMLVVGFITPLPYNYWRLKALEKVVAPKSKLGKLIQ